MKKIFCLFIILILCSITYAQEVPQGIFDIRWGDNMKQVKQKMIKQKGIEFVYKETGSTTSIGDIEIKDYYVERFYGGEFLGYKANDWIFSFINDKLYEILIDFECDYYCSSLFVEIKNIITEKYGKPDKNNEIQPDNPYSYWYFIKNEDIWGEEKFEINMILNIDKCPNIKKIGKKFKIDQKNISNCVDLSITNNKIESFFIENYLKNIESERKKKRDDLK